MVAPLLREAPEASLPSRGVGESTDIVFEIYTPAQATRHSIAFFGSVAPGTVSCNDDEVALPSGPSGASVEHTHLPCRVLITTACAS